MIRTWYGTVIIIEEPVNREEIIKKYQSFSSYKKKKFVIKNKNQVTAVLDYKDILLKRNENHRILEVSPNIFEQAIQYFQNDQSPQSGECVGVVNEWGELEFILEYMDNNNFMDHSEGKHYYQWFYNEDTKNEYDKGKIEQIFGGRNIVVFQSIDEYTIQIAKILLLEKQRFSDLKLYFTQKRAAYFFDDDEVGIISDSLKELEGEAYVMISSESDQGAKYQSTELRRTYQSLEIMMQLYQEAVEKELNPKIKQPFMIFDDELKWNGLVDIMKFSIVNALLAKKRGYIPVMNITKNCNYCDQPGENVWEYYFSPISGYGVDQAYASKNYVVVSRNYRQMFDEQLADCKKENLEYDLYKEIHQLSWRPDILKYCESEMPEQFKQNKRILGVISRGTDYNSPAVIARTGRNLVRNGTVEQLIDVTKARLRQENYEYIYLATEDYYNYTKYKEAFGDRVISTNQERIDLIKNKQYEKEVIARIPKQKSRYEYGLDYLVVLTCLSRCDALLSSMRCGAAVAAIGLNGEQYESVRIIKADE